MVEVKKNNEKIDFYIKKSVLAQDDVENAIQELNNCSAYTLLHYVMVNMEEYAQITIYRVGGFYRLNVVADKLARILLEKHNTPFIFKVDEVMYQVLQPYPRTDRLDVSSPSRNKLI